jgi:capsular polysaccharide biosynthesis protein
MTPEDRTGRTLDPEAEQEVDFARYGRLLAVRWWLLAAGLLAGALIGYAVSLGGSQVYSASATVYLGQPYSASGNIQLQTLQTNQSAVSAIVHSSLVDRTVAKQCDANLAALRGGIAANAVPGALTRNGQNPVVKIIVQTKKAKVSSCVANGLANKVIEKVSGYAIRKINNFRSQIATDTQYIRTLQTAISSSSVSTTDKLILQTQLRSYQQDKLAASQLLVQANQVEVPHVLTGAASERVTARSRRNTVVVAALIGLVLGALVALLWDRVAPRLRPANGA